MMNSKMADHHLARQACIYIRQSTPGQVRFNQESKERQYNLANQAKALGWMPEQIRILDGDLGHSGEQATHRDDFKTLVSDVAMGQVGAIFSLEASRLARSNKDWHRLLELCAITKTLVFDGDGCYDPADFNDGLVLGIKGQFAQAELHIIRARLHGAKLNKAQKGELRFPVPVGFVYTATRLFSIQTRKCKALFGQYSSCLSKRTAPTAWFSASSSSAFAFHAGLTVVPGMASSFGVV
jgi:DNA invertase Pin-like site-specific DNA recombinase